MRLGKVLHRAILEEDLITLRQCLTGTCDKVSRETADVNGLYPFEWFKPPVTMLHLAAKYGKADVIKFLLEQQRANPTVEVEYKKRGKINPLHTAIVHGNADCIIRLFNAIKKSMTKENFEAFIGNFYIRGENQTQPVESLVIFTSNVGSEVAMKAVVGVMCEHLIDVQHIPVTTSTDKLLQNKVVSMPDQLRNTPLHVAARIGNTKSARQLIRFHAGVDAVNADGDTPLHVAASCCQVEMAEFLLQNRASKELINNKGETPLYIAERLLNRDPNNPNKKRLLAAIMQTGFFALPIEESYSVRDVRGQIPQRFKEEMQRPGGLKRAITVFESAMDSYVHNQIMRIAVIGMGGTGKSSLINAFAGEEIAPTGSRCRYYSASNALQDREYAFYRLSRL